MQIKPQLERLLNLPEDALTKEVKMCQDLMSLFIEYQIPSDLLAYDGPASGSAPSKVQAVKDFIGNLQAMLAQVGWMPPPTLPGAGASAGGGDGAAAAAAPRGDETIL